MKMNSEDFFNALGFSKTEDNASLLDAMGGLIAEVEDKVVKYAEHKGISYTEAAIYIKSVIQKINVDQTEHPIRFIP